MYLKKIFYFKNLINKLKKHIDKYKTLSLCTQSLRIYSVCLTQQTANISLALSDFSPQYWRDVFYVHFLCLNIIYTNFRVHNVKEKSTFQK